MSMYFSYQLADGFKHLAEKPDEDPDVVDDVWHMSPGVRTFCRCAGHVCLALGVMFDRLGIWRYQAWHAALRAIRGTPAGVG